MISKPSAKLPCNTTGPAARRALLSLLAIGSMAMALGCRHLQQSSTPSEAPDIYNQPTTLGIQPPYRWDDVSAATSATLNHPWSDTYWPLAERGLAARYNADGSGGKVTSPITLHEVVQTNISASQTNDIGVLNYLSPAEKLDQLTSNVANIPESFLTSLKDNDTYYHTTVEPTLAPIAKQEKDIRDNYTRNIYPKYEAQSALVNQLSAQLTQAINNKDTAAQSTLTPQLDAAIKQKQEMEQTISGLSDQLTALQQQKRKLSTDFDQKSMSLANSLRQYMPLTGDGFEVWYSMEVSSIADYSWMGHCHGWSPASLIEQKPQRAVMASLNGKKILFTEGDIRGLLTKVWADQSPQKGEYFGAMRCETDKYNKDEFGRIIDGQICYGQTSGQCTDAAVGKRIYVKNNLIQRGFIEYSEVINGPSKYAVLTSGGDNENYSVIVLPTMSDVITWNRSENKTRPAGAQDAVLFFTKGCRDINPMTYHLALTKLLSAKQQGFVFDRTRSSQVWNQPVFGYNMTYLPTRLNAKDPSGNTLSKPGDLVAVADVNDPFKAYRAPNTAFFIVVQANVSFGVENGPMVTYNKSGTDEADEVMATTYTLELDAQRNIIGGEWGPIPNPDPNAPEAERNRQLIGGDTPDFVWYYNKTARPSNGPIAADVIEKIHQCSLKPSTGTTAYNDAVNSDSTTVQLEYVDCAL